MIERRASSKFLTDETLVVATFSRKTVAVHALLLFAYIKGGWERCFPAITENLRLQ